MPELRIPKEVLEKLSAAEQVEWLKALAIVTAAMNQPTRWPAAIAISAACLGAAWVLVSLLNIM